MSRDTVYLRPPNPPRSRKAKQKTGWEEFRDTVWKYRAQTLPFGVMFFVVCAAAIMSRLPGGTWWLTAAGAALAYGLYQDRYTPPAAVPWPDVSSPMERRYAALCAAVAGSWSVWATWYGHKPEPRAIAYGVLITCAISVPWWHHRRIRGSIAVRFHDVSPDERRTEMVRIQGLIRGWTAFCSAGHVQGSRLRRVEVNAWSTALHVRLRRGATVGELSTARRLEKLESAFGGVDVGSARVERDGKAEDAVLRFMRRDPHAEPVPPPMDDETTLDRMLIGIFETGEFIAFSLVNTLIAGASGAGKSGIVNMIIRALARIPNVAIVGIDMKPGATELSPWKGVMHALATDKESARDLLMRLRAGMEYRGKIMESQGKRKWKATRKHPFIVLIVDEVQELREAGLMTTLDRIIALFRAFGGAAIVATQHPTNANITAAIKMNCVQKIGARTESGSADRAIFGEGATRHGWRPSTIPLNREGSFFIRSPRYLKPCLGRAFWLEDEQIAEEALTWALERTDVDADTWDPAVRGEVLDALPAAPAAPADVVDAVLVDDVNPAELILSAMERGRTKVDGIAEATGMSRATVYRHLRRLQSEGLAESPSRGRWQSLRPEMADVSEPSH